MNKLKLSAETAKPIVTPAPADAVKHDDAAKTLRKHVKTLGLAIITK